MRSSMVAVFMCVFLVLISSRSEAEPQNSDSEKLFQRFVEENYLGDFSGGTWNFDPPEELSESNHFGNLAFALELYRSYSSWGDVTKGGFSLQKLIYDEWLLEEDDISRYLDAEDSLLTQSRILSEYLNRQ